MQDTNWKKKVLKDFTTPCSIKETRMFEPGWMCETLYNRPSFAPEEVTDPIRDESSPNSFNFIEGQGSDGRVHNPDATFQPLNYWQHQSRLEFEDSCV